MKRVPFLSALLFVVAAAGCGPKQSVVGTWSASNMPGVPPGSVAKITYSEGEKLGMTFTVDQEGGGLKFRMIMSVDGTYKVSGDRITHKVEKVDFKVEGLDAPTTKRVMEAVEPQRAKLLEDMNREPDQTFEWKSKDELIFKTKKGDTILKRE